MGEALAARLRYSARTYSTRSLAGRVSTSRRRSSARGAASLHDDLPAQVGVFAVSIAALDVLEREHGLVPSAVAGYSLGTYAAFVAAGCLDRWAALDVLLEAQRLLDEERRTGAADPGGMGFVIGLSKDAIEAAIRGTSVSIGTENAAQQFVLTGEARAVAAAIDGFRPKALRAEMLPMTQSMHSSRLGEMTRRLRICFEGKRAIGAPKRHLYAPMLGGRVSSLEEVLSVLFGQLARPSLWAQTLGAMGADGFSLFAEVGPGDVLAKLLRWTLRDAKGFVVENPETAATFASAVAAFAPATSAGRKAASRA